MSEVVHSAMLLESFEHVVSVELESTTWDYYLRDEDANDCAPPFKGSNIRYRLKNQKLPWKNLDDSWVVYVHEQTDIEAFKEALQNHAVKQKALDAQFKLDVLKAFNLDKHPNREKVWEKAVEKFASGSVDENTYKNMLNYVKELSELIN